MRAISDELSTAVARLREAGIESPQLDAQILMAHALRCPRLEVISHPERLLTPSQEAAFQAMLTKRASRCPLSYIIGEKEFFGLSFVVSSDVLIPRPETEILVEECLRRVGDGAVIADIGTGSGAIAVALAVNLPGANVYATDTSEQALKVAKVNAEKHGVADRVCTVRGDLLEALSVGVVGHAVPEQRQERLDAIVSNPPYIPSGVIESLEPEVRQEPIQALDGGPDGLEVYRRLVPQALGLAGLIAVEIGVEQASPVTQIARDAGWAEVEIIRDLAGIERVVIARQ